MPHKADRTFFDRKNQWSERKDEILRSYLVPYLPKVATQGAPILIVDAFAGPGQFRDGQPGSPLIICRAVREAQARNLPVDVQVLCIEADDVLYGDLASHTAEYEFAKARYAKFAECIDDIEALARDHTVFLYVDPWTVEGIEWALLDRVFRHLTASQMSVEILLNFNAQSLARRGLAALKAPVPDVDEAIEDAEEIDEPATERPVVAKLDRVVGGTWWQPVLKSLEGFPDKVRNLTVQLSEQLRSRFHETCFHAIKALPHHTVPKYYLIFASRHPDALLLMNNECVKSRRTLAKLAQLEQPTLFETRSFELVPELDELPSLILQNTGTWTNRKLATINVMRGAFGVFHESEIHGRITQMLKNGALKSSTGKSRINDATRIVDARRS